MSPFTIPFPRPTAPLGLDGPLVVDAVLRSRAGLGGLPVDFPDLLQALQGVRVMPKVLDYNALRVEWFQDASSVLRARGLRPPGAAVP